MSATVTGLVPNALYHVRLVATNPAGTATGPDQTFTTLKDPAPPAPVLGKEANFFPVNGLVFVKFPGSHSAADQFGPNAAFTKGQGFIPLTEARQLPIGTQVDARRGTMKIATATSHQGKTQSGMFSSGLFKLAQTRRGFHKGLTTLSLLEGAFPGAPSYASCSAKATDPGAHTARVNFSNLNVLRSRDHHGQFRTRGRYSAGTVVGTVWDTIDRCAGTLTECTAAPSQYSTSTATRPSSSTPATATSPAPSRSAGTSSRGGGALTPRPGACRIGAGGSGGAGPRACEGQLDGMRRTGRVWPAFR